MACTVNQHGMEATSVHVELIDLNTGVITEKGSQWLSSGFITSRRTRLSADFTGDGEAIMLIVTVSYTASTHFAWFRCCGLASPGQHCISVHKALLDLLGESSKSGSASAWSVPD